MGPLHRYLGHFQKAQYHNEGHNTVKMTSPYKTDEDQDSKDEMARIDSQAKLRSDFLKEASKKGESLTENQMELLKQFGKQSEDYLKRGK